MSALAGVRPRNAPIAQGGGQTLEIGDRHVHGGHVIEQEPDRLGEVDPDATGLIATEGDVVMPQACADTDGGDPEPRAFDPPPDDVGQWRPHAETAEPRVELPVEGHDGVVLTNPEQQPEEAPGTRPDPDRERSTDTVGRGGAFVTR